MNGRRDSRRAAAGRGTRLFSIYRAVGEVPPGRRFAMREWVLNAGATRPAGRAVFARTLEDARSAMPPGVCYRLGRSPGDEPELVESWI